jgi:hypothetical protein
MNIRHLLRRFLKLNALEGDTGGGGGGAPAADTGAAPAPAADVGGGEPAAAPAAPAAPSSMLEAIEQHFGQPRDALGRFVHADAAAAAAAQPQTPPAADATGQPGAAQQGAQPQQAQQPATQQQPGQPEDLTKMPEGLTPKAQERFQKLANTVKEREQEVQQLSQQVEYVRETFQRHGVQQEQFEQAVQVIGMLNSGDLRGALQVLDEQRRHIALALGEPLPGVDALQGHPDLRQAVDGLQITEQHALELARMRTQQQAVQRQQQQVQQQTQVQQREQQAVQQGTQAVDAFCREMAAKDVDYPAIEAKLLPELKSLLAGVPPQAWAQVIQTQYRLLKSVAASSRQQAPAAPAGTVLRPTGAASPAAAPKSMYEAMWGGR